MAKQYLDKLSTLIAKTTSETFQAVSLECKHFFGGAAVYENGKICISLTHVGFAIKFPQTSGNQLMPAIQPADLRGASCQRPSPCPCRPSRRQNRLSQPRSPHVAPKSGASWSDGGLPRTSLSSAAPAASPPSWERE